MSNWRRLFPAGDLRNGCNRFFSLDGLELAVFRLDSGELLATQNSCPHAGGNLSAGKVENGVVTCPWHEWKFDLRSGACVHNESICARTYGVRENDGWIEVDVGGD